MNVVRVRGERRGFASVAAIVLIAIVGLALVVVMQRFAAAARQTRAAAADAQLRQLLLAGGYVANETLARATVPVPNQVLAVALPPELRDAGARVATTLSVEPAAATAHIQALLGRTGKASATLRWDRGSAGWQLVSFAEGQ